MTSARAADRLIPARASPKKNRVRNRRMNITPLGKGPTRNHHVALENDRGGAAGRSANGRTAATGTGAFGAGRPGCCSVRVHAARRRRFREKAKEDLP